MEKSSVLKSMVILIFLTMIGIITGLLLEKNRIINDKKVEVITRIDTVKSVIKDTFFDTIKVTEIKYSKKMIRVKDTLMIKDTLVKDSPAKTIVLEYDLSSPCYSIDKEYKIVNKSKDTVGKIKLFSTVCNPLFPPNLKNIDWTVKLEIEDTSKTIYRQDTVKIMTLITQKDIKTNFIVGSIVGILAFSLGIYLGKR